MAIRTPTVGRAVLRAECLLRSAKRLEAAAESAGVDLDAKIPHSFIESLLRDRIMTQNELSALLLSHTQRSVFSIAASSIRSGFDRPRMKKAPGVSRHHAESAMLADELYACIEADEACFARVNNYARYRVDGDTP